VVRAPVHELHFVGRAGLKHRPQFASINGVRLLNLAASQI
jgi:hypothetical protein